MFCCVVLSLPPLGVAGCGWHSLCKWEWSRKERNKECKGRREIVFLSPLWFLPKKIWPPPKRGSHLLIVYAPALLSSLGVFFKIHFHSVGRVYSASEFSVLSLAWFSPKNYLRYSWFFSTERYVHRGFSKLYRELFSWVGIGWLERLFSLVWNWLIRPKVSTNYVRTANRDRRFWLFTKD